MKLCSRCKKRKTHSAHPNSKWCNKCRLELLRRPESTLSKEQIRHAKSLIGKMDRRDIAKELGCSLSSLKRAFRGVRLAYHNKWAINPKFVREVCAYYEKHGRPETEKRYPGVPIRSIIEHYKQFKPRQVRWTGEQIMEAARMAGLINYELQAKFFRRPRAYAGSVKSLWNKRFGFRGGSINGMSEWHAKEIVSKNCPYIKSKFWKGRKQTGTQYGRKLYLWCDMRNHLRRGVPPFIREAVDTMADFQCWLHRTDEPRKSVLKIIRERS